MFKSKRVILLASIMMLLAVVFTGCQQNEEEPPVEVEESEDLEVEDEIEDEIHLSDWEGTWNNMGAYLEHEELEVAFADLAEREEVSVEDAKSDYIEDRKAEFDGFIVEGNKAMFLDGFEEDDGEVIEEAEYEYKETVIAKHGNFDTEWYSFESNGDSAYKYLLLMPVHGEEALTHFHLRYGDSVEELLELEDWYPTFVRPDSTYDQLYEEITE